MTIDDHDLRPPSAARIARRTLVLAAAACRGAIEGGEHDAEIAALRRDLAAWTSEMGLDDEIEPDERRLLDTPLGELPDEDGAAASWRAEGLVVLGWALGRNELPAYDQTADASALTRGVGLLSPPDQTVLAAPTARSATEIEAYANQVAAVRWRLVRFELDGAVIDFPAFAATAWFGPLDLSAVRLKRGDLALGRRRIDRATSDARAVASRAAEERLVAVRWLRGDAGDLFRRLGRHVDKRCRYTSVSSREGRQRDAHLVSQRFEAVRTGEL